MDCRFLLIAIALCQLRNCLNMEISGCECLRTQEVFDILQTIVTGSGLRHLTIITHTTQPGCGSLTDLAGVRLSIFSCSNWNFNLLLTASVNHETTLRSIIINCDINNTGSIVQELLAARSAGGVERRLLLPVYNLILTQPVRDNVTLMLDLSAIHQVSIVRDPRPTVLKAGCWGSEYKVQTREGHGAWRVVGRYRDSYQGHPGFIRNKFVNFEGMHLKVTYAVGRPFIMKEDEVYVGFCIDLLVDLARHLNFTYELIYSIDKKFGVKTSNGNWNGMIGMMERQEVDMVMADMTISALRETVVDFTYPFLTTPSAIVVRAEITKTEVPWSYLFDPLQLYVWIATAGSLVFCAVIIYLFDQFATFIKYDNGGGMSHIDHIASSLQESAWLMVCLYARQAAERLSSAGSVRLSLAVLWLVPLLVWWSYCANLTASLTTVETRPPFNTLEELAEDTEYTLLLEGGAVQRLLLENSKSGVYAALWDKVLKTKDVSLVSSTTAAMTEMFNDTNGVKKYAAIASRISIRTKLATLFSSRCDWALIPETFWHSGYGIALPEGSPYKEVFDTWVMAAVSSGVTQKYQRRHFYRTTCEEIKQGTQAVSVNISLDHVKTIFVLLMAGFAVSAAVFCVEHVSFRKL